MRSVALSEAKDRLSEFVAAAEAGDEIVITRHGKARARLVAVENVQDRRLQAEAALEELAIMRAKMRAEGRTVTREELKAWKDEGRP